MKPLHPVINTNLKDISNIRHKSLQKSSDQNIVDNSSNKAELQKNIFEKTSPTTSQPHPSSQQSQSLPQSQLTQQNQSTKQNELVKQLSQIVHSNQAVCQSQLASDDSFIEKLKQNEPSTKSKQTPRKPEDNVQKLQETLDRFKNTFKNHNKRVDIAFNNTTTTMTTATATMLSQVAAFKEYNIKMNAIHGRCKSRKKSDIIVPSNNNNLNKTPTEEKKEVELLSSTDNQKQKVPTELDQLTTQIKTNVKELRTKRIANALHGLTGEIIKDPLEEEQKFELLQNTVNTAVKIKEYMQEKSRLKKESSELNNNELDDLYKRMANKIVYNTNQTRMKYHDGQDLEITPLDTTTDIIKKTNKVIEVMNEIDREKERETKKDIGLAKKDMKNIKENNNAMELTALKTVIFAEENPFDEEEIEKVILESEKQQELKPISSEKYKSKFLVRPGLQAIAYSNHMTSNSPIIFTGTSDLNKSFDTRSKINLRNENENTGDFDVQSKKNSKKIINRRSKSAFNPNKMLILNDTEKEMLKQEIETKVSKKVKNIEEKLNNMHYRMSQMKVISQANNEFRLESLKYTKIFKERAKTVLETKRKFYKKLISNSSSNPLEDKLSQSPRISITPRGGSMDKNNNNISTFDKETKLVEDVRDLLLKPSTNSNGMKNLDIRNAKKRLGLFLQDKLMIPQLHMKSYKLSKLLGHG